MPFCLSRWRLRAAMTQVRSTQTATAQDAHGYPITRDALRARLGVSNQAASELLRSSALTRACLREPPVPPDPGCLPAPAGALVRGG